MSALAYPKAGYRKGSRGYQSGGSGSARRSLSPSASLYGPVSKPAPVALPAKPTIPAKAVANAVARTALGGLAKAATRANPWLAAAAAAYVTYEWWNADRGLVSDAKMYWPHGWIIHRDCGFTARFGPIGSESPAAANCPSNYQECCFNISPYPANDPPYNNASGLLHRRTLNTMANPSGWYGLMLDTSTQIGASNYARRFPWAQWWYHAPYTGNIATEPAPDQLQRPRRGFVEPDIGTPEHEIGTIDDPVLSPEIPALDPLTMPPLRWAPSPARIPYRVLPKRWPNPWRHPQEQPTRGPRPDRRPRPSDNPHEEPEEDPRPRPLPRRAVNRSSRVPASVGQIDTRGRFSLDPAGRHARRPAKRGEYEVKTRLPFGLFHAATEVQDFVDCIHSAIPYRRSLLGVSRIPRPGARSSFTRVTGSGRRTGRLSPKGVADTGPKIVDIWRNRNSIDWAGAFRCLALNAVEDAIIGRVRGRLTPSPDRVRIGPVI